MADGSSGRATPRAAAVVARLGLVPHPEGGWYRETWRDAPHDGSRGAGTAIYYLLEGARPSAWHRVDAAEVWHHYAGAALDLEVVGADGAPATWRLGDDVLAGEVPQAVVPVGAWQRARSRGRWTLVGCTVSPAFVDSGFELAADDWEPGG